MSSSAFKSKIGKEDLHLWDGVSNTYTRETSTGGDLTLHPIGDMVDVLQLYGGGTTQTDGPIDDAIRHIGNSSKAILNLAPGTWTISGNLTIPTNIGVRVPFGSIISVSSGKTLTINGPIDAGSYQIFSGAGTVVFGSGSVDCVLPQWWTTNTVPGTTDMTSAMTTAEATGLPVYWRYGTYNVTSTPTLNKSWGAGKMFTSGVRVYLHPTPESCKVIHAEVFDLTATDAGPAIQRAVDYAQLQKLPLLFPHRGDYKITTGVIAKLGTGATGPHYDFDVDFNYSYLRPDAGITALTVQPQCLHADTATGRQWAGLRIRNVIISGLYANTASRALQIGRTGYAHYGSNWGLIENVEIANDFPAALTVASTFENVGLIKFHNFVSYQRVYLLAADTSGFTGDFVFDGCQFVKWGTGSGINLSAILIQAGNAASTTPVPQVRGIKFTDCNFYGLGIRLIAALYSQVGDMFFSGCQFDSTLSATATTVIQGEASGNGELFALNFVNSSAGGGLAGCAMDMHLQDATASIQEISLLNFGIGYIDVTSFTYKDAINWIGVTNSSINGLIGDNITGTTAAAVVGLADCVGVSITNGRVSANTTMPYGISISGASDDYLIVGNAMSVTSAIINDTATGSPNKVTEHNLALP